MNKRIRKLRKQLNLSQTQFGREIGLTQKPVSEMERDGGTVTERNFNAICKAFNVNPVWLRDGIGAMFLENREALIESVAKEFGLFPEEIALMRMYFDLPREYRKGVITFAKNFVATMGQYPSEIEEQKPEDELTREERHKLLDDELDAQEAAEKRGTITSSASTGLNGVSKKFFNGS